MPHPGKCLSFLFVILFLPASAHSFCGAYLPPPKVVGKLSSKDSKAVLVWYKGQTALTMVKSYKGDLKGFIILIPVPTVVPKSQVRVVEQALIDRLDEASAPRLLDHGREGGPSCRGERVPMVMSMERGGKVPQKREGQPIKIEAKYTVGEYDIVILSAKDSEGLQDWLKTSGYQIPAGAAEVIESY